MDTLFHAKQVDPSTLVWDITALAEAIGIRAVARIFETETNTVLRWLIEAAEHLEAFSRYHLSDFYVDQVQMDERVGVEFPANLTGKEAKGEWIPDVTHRLIDP